MKYLLNFVFMAFAVVSFGQRDISDDSPNKLKDRLYFGGGGGLSGGTDSYGNRYFTFSLSPVVGYMVTPQFSVGTGIIYQNQSYTDLNIKIEQWGVMPFVRYNFNQFYLTSEFQYINAPTFNGSSQAERKYYTRFLAGAGYTVPIGGRMKLNAQGLYDLTYRENGPFASPWVFRIFFSL